jgi:hypothetical protein
MNDHFREVGNSTEVVPFSHSNFPYILKLSNKIIRLFKIL